MPAHAPRAGDRFPWLQLQLAGSAAEDSFAALDDLRFHLLVIGASAPARMDVGGSIDIKVTSIPGDGANGAELARAHVPIPSFYLLRPDGHVGLCGTGEPDAAEIRAYVTDVLGARHVPPAADPAVTRGA